MNPENTVQMTPRINRHRRSVEIEVIPCTDYFFKVIASEDWKGLREDFKVFSEVVKFKVAYTPKFLTPPMVKERGRTRPPPNLRNTQQDMGYNYGYNYGGGGGYGNNYGMMADTVGGQQPGAAGGAAGNMGMGPPQNQMIPPPPVMPVTPKPPEEPEDFTIKVGWRLKDIDYPICLGNPHI